MAVDSVSSPETCVETVEIVCTVPSGITHRDLFELLSDAGVVVKVITITVDNKKETHKYG